MSDDPKSSPRVGGQFPVIGIPGQHSRYIVVPMFPEGDARNDGGPEGLPGEYEVTFTLHRPGYPLQPEKSANSSDGLEGDSHLRIAQTFRVKTILEGETFAFEGNANSRGFLATLVTKCRATAISDAHDKCYRAIAPMLSDFSLKWDIPLKIYQVDVQELRERGLASFHTKRPLMKLLYAVNSRRQRTRSL